MTNHPALAPRSLGTLTILALAALAAALTTACSEDTPAPEASASASATFAAAATGPADTNIEVTLDEWSVAPQAPSVSAGAIGFVVTNNGTVAHELVIVRTNTDAADLPVQDGRVPEAALDVIGEVEEFPAGLTDSGIFRLDPGHYVLLCNLPAHYGSGMYTDFTVE